MPKDGTTRLERFLDTEPGQRFLEEAERQAAVKEEGIADRRALAAELAEWHRRRREVEPELDRVAQAAWEVANRAKAEYEALRDKASDAGRASHLEHMAIYDGVRTTEARLLRSADRRTLAATEEADEVLRTWSETYKNHHRFRSEKATSWDGTDTWVKRYGTNEAGVDTLKKGIEGAQATVKKLMLVPEPADEDIETAVAKVRAAIEATHGDPPPLVLQQFDSNGKPVGKPVEMPVVR